MGKVTKNFKGIFKKKSKKQDIQKRKDIQKKKEILDYKLLIQ